MHLIDMNGEKEKIQFALELAIHEVSKKTRRGEEEDDPDLNESKQAIEARRKT